MSRPVKVFRAYGGRVVVHKTRASRYTIPIFHFDVRLRGPFSTSHAIFSNTKLRDGCKKATNHLRHWAGGIRFKYDKKTRTIRTTYHVA